MSVVLKAAPALLLSALLFSPAAAAPVGPNTMGAIPDSLVIQVRDGGKGHHGRSHGGKGRHGTAHRGGPRHGHGNRHYGNRHHGYRPHHHYHGRRWVAGRTYYVAPPGWRQYGVARPWNWQALGCVIVNGFWFCP
ncbi:hypothetical protein [Pseudorhodoplanes sp.]|uniref:hypothetical protein n=1 Tax=Pseudorhodoplanes sp. TaxID=1934341 RepID=UPI00391AA009